ncbi:MAG: 2-hydroxyacyl-CoA dehydratase [Candidatus Baldrarchaeia archaeon]
MVLVGALQQLISIGEKLTNPYLEEWKRKGKKIIGFICSYAPEELLYAADVLPYRIKALESVETTMGDVYLYKYHCTFCRHLLDLVIRGRYDFLDGVVFMNPCDTIRRVYEIWKKMKVLPFMGFVMVPHVINEHGSSSTLRS